MLERNEFEIIPQGFGSLLRLPVPSPEQTRNALAAIGVITTEPLILIADLDLRVVVPVIDVAYSNSVVKRRVAVLLAFDGTPVARDMANAMNWLRHGCIPTHAEAYRASQMARKPLDLPLRRFEQGDRIPASCMASASPRCRGEGALGVCRARQVLSQGRAFLSDEGTLRWVCGACAISGADSFLLAHIRDEIEKAQDPFGLEFGGPVEPPSFVTLNPTTQAETTTHCGPKPVEGGAYRKKGAANWDERAFLRPWSPQLAYSLGVIAGDGAIHPKRIVIELAPEDSDILRSVCSALGANPSRITSVHRSKQQVPTAKLDLSSPIAAHHLLSRLGLAKFGPKHSVVGLPKDLPDEFLADFVRGFLDADGSVNQSGANSPVIQIYSNSLDLLNQMRERIAPVLGSPLLGAIHQNSGSDSQGRPRKGWAWVMTGYEAKDFVLWLWPDQRPWIGGARKFHRAKALLFGWEPRRGQKAKRRKLGPLGPPSEAA